MIQRRSVIEEKMLASYQTIENAFMYADKALAFAFGRRMQDLGKLQHVLSHQNHATTASAAGLTASLGIDETITHDRSKLTKTE